jgi:uncharacterized membrane protein SirB2
MSLEGMATRLQETAFSELLQAVPWVVPALQAIHILMIGVVFVSILVVALRMLGRVRADEPLVRVWSRFAPFLWIGLVVMAATGLLLIAAEPVREVMTLSFRLKAVLLVIAIGSAIAFGRSVRRAASAGLAGPVSPLMRAAAIATVVLWLSIIFLGRAIAYDDSIWGAWSPAVAQQGLAP